MTRRGVRGSGARRLSAVVRVLAGCRRLSRYADVLGSRPGRGPADRIRPVGLLTAWPLAGPVPVRRTGSASALATVVPPVRLGVFPPVVHTHAHPPKGHFRARERSGHFALTCSDRAPTRPERPPLSQRPGHECSAREGTVRAMCQECFIILSASMAGIHPSAGCLSHPSSPRTRPRHVRAPRLRDAGSPCATPSTRVTGERGRRGAG